MPDSKVVVEQGSLKTEYVIGYEDSRLLEQLAQFAERASHENARAALVFMAYVIRDAHRRHDLSP